MFKKININKKSFFYNTLIILITGFIIKLLGLIYRIIITRTLGEKGMTLYIMSFPTIMLFINISCLSLNITISKLVSESIKTKQYSPKILLKKAIHLALITSIITIILYLLMLYPLTFYLLKNEDLFLPLLSAVFLIPLVGISDSLKGYFNGLKLMNHTSIANLIEQISRIIFSTLLLILMIPYGIKLATFFCLLALSIGELFSIIYSSIKIKKLKIIHYENTKNELNAIIKISIPSTLSHLIGNFTYFLEPIVYVWILSLLNHPIDKINSMYTIINAYTISLLTLGSFVSNAIGTTIVPSISESHALNKTDSVNYYIKKAIIFSLVPAFFITAVLFIYPEDLMNLVYGTSSGSNLIKYYVIFFIPYYLEAPLSSIYHSLGCSKSLFKISSFFNILRILLIIILSTINKISYQSIILSTAITLIGFTFIVYLNIKKLTNIKVSYNKSLSLLLIFIFTFFSLCFFKLLNINYIISIFINGLIYLFWCYILKLINIKSLLKAY